MNFLILLLAVVQLVNSVTITETCSSGPYQIGQSLDNNAGTSSGCAGYVYNFSKVQQVDGITVNWGSCYCTGENTAYVWISLDGTTWEKIGQFELYQWSGSRTLAMTMERILPGTQVKFTGGDHGGWMSIWEIYFTLSDPVIVNCVESWSPCSENCQKTLTIQTPANNLGTPCTGEDGATETCQHGVDACPIPLDCEGSWSTCSESCISTYTITQAGNQYGGECTAENNVTVECDRGTDLCPASEVLVIEGASCFCGADENADVCDVGEFCYDDECEASPKYNACPVNQYDAVKHTCGCEELTVCEVGSYCYGGGCHANAECHRPKRHDPFYGAKLYATWFPSTNSMEMSIDVPSYMTLNSVLFHEAQDRTILAYDSDNVGLWQAKTSEDHHCVLNYGLNVNQNTFFGPGSRFTINGMQMKTVLKVDVSEHTKHRHNGHTLTRERHIHNVLPLLVNLVEETMITCDFTVTYATVAAEDSWAGPCIAVVIPLDPETVDEEVLLSECQSTYGNTRNVICDSIEESEEGTTQVNLEGEQNDIDNLVAELSDNGWNTASTGQIDAAAYCPALEPEEFLLFLDAYDNVFLDGDAAGTITLKIEVHSRGCIDHDGNGVRVSENSLEYIIPDRTVFEWDTDEEGEIIAERQGELCQEMLTWTFAPKEEISGPYDVTINLEFDLQEDIPSFTASAAIRLEPPTDVLDQVGFETEIGTFSDREANNPADTFNVGQKFWAKIELSNLVVETDNIVCTAMTVTQEEDEFGTIVQKNMMEPEFNFEQVPKEDHGLPNTAICGAELESADFHISLDGWDSVLEIQLSVTYVQGRQEDVTVRRKLVGKNVEDTLLNDNDALFANTKRKPDQKIIATHFYITDSGETMLAAVFESMSENRGYSALFFLATFMTIGCSIYKLLSKKTNDDFFLLEEEY